MVEVTGWGLEQGWKTDVFNMKNFRFLGFDLQLPDTKLRPTSTMKSKDKSSKQRFGHVNATNHGSYLNIIFNKLVIQ